MIKEIHCFGTSHTEGGGFEFFNQNIASKLKKIYTEQPFTQFNYSYPGQLQKLIGSGVKVFNHGKSGYGNERMYRIAYDLIMNNEDSLSEKLFIFEFSFLGRKEFYSNTLKDHFIVNYEIILNFQLLALLALRSLIKSSTGFLSIINLKICMQTSGLD